MKAVINYFLYKTPIDKFVKEDNDIRDFLMSQSVNREFKVEYGESKFKGLTDTTHQQMVIA